MPIILLTFFTHDHKLLCMLFGSNVVSLFSTHASLARHLTCPDGSIAASLFLTPLCIMYTFLPQPLPSTSVYVWIQAFMCMCTHTHTHTFLVTLVFVFQFYCLIDNKIIKRVQTLDSAWRVLTYDSTTITSFKSLGLDTVGLST